MIYGLRFWILAGLGSMAFSSQMAAAQARCELVLEGANVFTGEGFERRDLHISGGMFVAAAPQGAQRIDAGFWTVVPPLADVHTHAVNQPREASVSMHRALMDEGIYYALNPNNIRFNDELPLAPDHVEGVYTGGGITKPGEHPRPAYEGLARFGRAQGLGIDEIAGRAFHEVTTPKGAREAVAEVERQGAKFVKLYVLRHDDPPNSDGLDPASFRAAVDEARSRGMYPVSHVETARDFALAVDAGVHAIVHMPAHDLLERSETLAGDLIHPQTAALAAEKAIFVVPTIAVAFNALSGDELRQAQLYQNANLRTLRDAGVRIAAGADRWGATVKDELALMRASGVFSGPELVKIGTTNGIEMAFPERNVGRLEPGQEASFLAILGDPAGNWYGWNTIIAGMRGGVKIEGRAIPDSCAP